MLFRDHLTKAQVHKKVDIKREPGGSCGGAWLNCEETVSPRALHSMQVRESGSLVPTLRAPPGEKRGDERSQPKTVEDQRLRDR